MKKIEGIVKTKAGRRKYKVICTVCGYRSQVRVSKWKKDSICKRCSTIERNKSRSESGQDTYPIARTFLSYFKNSAKRRKIEFKLTQEYVSSIWTGRCALSGLPIDASKSTDGNGNHKPCTASLDRIDSSKGYVEGNVQWVHKSVNIMKNSLTQDEFISLCYKIASNHANQQPSVLKGNDKSKHEGSETRE